MCNQWIPVEEEDKLPYYLNESVLVWVEPEDAEVEEDDFWQPEGYATSAILEKVTYKGRECPVWLHAWNREMIHDQDEITHWQPKPKSPWPVNVSMKGLQ